MPLRINEQQFAELAAGLVTSSTIERYEWCVGNARLTQALAHRIDTDSALFVEEAWRQWTLVLRTPERSESEILLAALLFVLGQSGVARVEQILTACALATSPQAAWVAALARRLLASRPGETTIQLVDAAEWHIPRSRNSAGDAVLTLPLAA